MRQLILDIRPNATPRLQDFIAGDNAATLAAVRGHLAQKDGSVLYLWGEEGSGRSHLLRAAATASGGRYIAADHTTDLPAQAGLTALDDIEQLDAAAQASLFRLLIGAREAGMSLLLAGNAPPAALPLRDDVKSRIAQGTTYRLHPLDDDARAELLRRAAVARGMPLDEDVIQWLLRHGERSVPWLLAVLDALDEASLAHSRRVTVPLVRELLS